MLPFIKRHFVPPHCNRYINHVSVGTKCSEADAVAVDMFAVALFVSKTTLSRPDVHLSSSTDALAMTYVDDFWVLLEAIFLTCSYSLPKGVSTHNSNIFVALTKLFYCNATSMHKIHCCVRKKLRFFSVLSSETPKA